MSRWPECRQIVFLSLAILWGCEGQAQSPAPVVPKAPETWVAQESERTWKFLVLHHSATESGSVESIDAEHRQRRDSAGEPWRGIGYHFVVGNGNGLGDGVVAPTFRWKEQSAGAHAGQADYNEHGIGICLIGNFEETRPTAKQLESLQRLVGYLKREHAISTDRVLKHGDIKGTACPGRNFPASIVAATPPWRKAQEATDPHQENRR